MDRNKAIEIKKLNYGYRSNWTMGRSAILKDVSLDVYEGESFGFLGQNGAGKTTTIKCLLNLLYPTSGTAKIFGKDSSDIQSRQQVGYVPEQPYFYDYIKVEEMVAMSATLSGVTTAEVKEKVKLALTLAKIDHKATASLRSLSKGQTQRVAIAQAIVGNPKILILDEPFSGLDPLGRKEVCDLFFNLKEQGTTIFVCSHILKDIEFLCDRVSIMSHGEIMGVFDLAELPRLAKGEYELTLSKFETIEGQLSSLSTSCTRQDPFIRCTFEEAEKAKEALKIAVDSNAHIESYNFVHGSLEDLFLTLIKKTKE